MVATEQTVVTQWLLWGHSLCPLSRYYVVICPLSRYYVHIYVRSVGTVWTYHQSRYYVDICPLSTVWTDIVGS